MSFVNGQRQQHQPQQLQYYPLGMNVEDVRNREEMIQILVNTCICIPSPYCIGVKNSAGDLAKVLELCTLNSSGSGNNLLQDIIKLQENLYRAIAQKLLPSSSSTSKLIVTTSNSKKRQTNDDIDLSPSKKSKNKKRQSVTWKTKEGNNNDHDTDSKREGGGEEGGGAASDESFNLQKLPLWFKVCIVYCLCGSFVCKLIF